MTLRSALAEGGRLDDYQFSMQINNICRFDFQKNYGEMGRGFIHVHHLTDIATIGTEYEVDPHVDLRPVCPNCHAMLHTQRPAINIEELKTLFVKMAEGGDADLSPRISNTE